MLEVRMNYQKHYDTLINRAKTRILTGYVERHHIVPRCMEGTDDLSNIAVLTPEEHYTAHMLLVKIYPNNYSLLCAVRMMSYTRKGNKLYGWLKRKARFTTPRKKETKPRKKRVLTEEHKRKIGLAGIGRTFTAETRQKISQKNIETKSKQNLKGKNSHMWGRHHSEETKRKISQTKLAS